MVRFASRYIQHSFAGMVKEFLDDFGWTVQPPFGIRPPVKFYEVSPRRSDLDANGINAVYVSFGDESDRRNTELGSGVLRSEQVFFVDVVAENESVGLVIAADIQDRLTGLQGGTRYLRPADANGVPLEGYLVELSDIGRRQPEAERRNWYVIDGTMVIDFPGEDS